MGDRQTAASENQEEAAPRPVAQGQRLARLAAEAADGPSPRAALRKVTELRRELDAFERKLVARALADGASYASIGRDLGLTRQAVHRRFRNVVGDELSLRVSPDVGRILRYAREEAVAMQAERIGTTHVVLGVLRAPDVPAAGVLLRAGATLGRARTQIGGMGTRGRLFRRDDDAADGRELLGAAAQEARARNHHRIEPEHLLACALQDQQGGASRTLRALGVDPETLREELVARLSALPADEE
jgi:ATP-dependent Clp protease ATP-binding subunit ClpA